jgi:hypothetical protein
VCNLTDTLLGQGLYYAALAANGTNNYVASTPGNVAMVKVLGVRQASTAYTLPATITFETAASAYIPGFSIWLRSN